MVVDVVCILLLILAVILYLTGKKASSTFIFFLFLTDGFLLFHPEWISSAPISKYTDFALVYLIFVICYRTVLKGVGTLKGRNGCQELFAILTLFITIVFCFTIILQKETVGYALAVYRNYLFFFSFVLFNELKPKALKSVFVAISIMTISTAVIYVSQPIHHFGILSGSVGDMSGSSMVARYRNIPELLYFYMIYYTIKMSFARPRVLLLLAICLVSMILTQHRAVILAYGICVAVYLLLTHKTKKILQVAVISLFGIILFGGVILDRFQDKEHVSTFDDIKVVLTLNYERAAISDYDQDRGGTLSFRALMVFERLSYLWSHPQYLLTGIGTRHEDSPKTSEFNFVLGARKFDASSGYWVKQQIDCADMAWFNPLMRFGLIGLFLFAFLTLRMLKYYFERRGICDLTMSLFLYYLLLCIISFKNNMLFAPIQVAFLFLSMSMIDKVKRADPLRVGLLLDFDVLSGKFKRKVAVSKKNRHYGR